MARADALGGRADALGGRLGAAPPDVQVRVLLTALRASQRELVRAYRLAAPAVLQRVFEAVLAVLYDWETRDVPYPYRDECGCSMHDLVLLMACEEWLGAEVRAPVLESALFRKIAELFGGSPSRPADLDGLDDDDVAVLCRAAAAWPADAASPIPLTVAWLRCENWDDPWDDVAVAPRWLGPAPEPEWPAPWRLPPP
jgi:hypothetical protein